MTFNRKKILVTSSIAFAVSLLSACGNRDRVESGATDDILNLTISIDTLSEAPQRPEIRTKDEAMALMAEPEDSVRYNAGILPRMLEEVPKYAIKLLNNTHDGFIIADKYTMRVILYDKFGCVRKEYKMACSKNYGTKHKKRDNRTPEGFFSIEGVYDSTEWLFTDDDGVTSDVKGQFGPRFIRLKIPVTSQIGIHGTCAPWSLGGRRSHGCIRIANENILELAELVEPGMPVIVSPGRRDMAVNEEEGYDIPAVSTGKTRPTPLQLPKPVEPVDTTQTIVADSAEIAKPDSIPAITIQPDSIDDEQY